jgi:hypothetical protein
VTYFHDTTTNVAALATDLSGPMIVAKAWLRAEGQTVNNPTNPLNIRYYGSPGQTGRIGGFATYASAASGLRYAAALILHSTYYAGVRRALATWHANPGNRTAIVNVARAIEDSPWAAGHYGGGGSADGIITRYVMSHLPIIPPPAWTGNAYISTLTHVYRFTSTGFTPVGYIHGGGTIVPVGSMIVHLGLHFYPILGGTWKGYYLHSGETSFKVVPRG